MDKGGILGPNKGRYGQIRAIKGKYVQIRTKIIFWGQIRVDKIKFEQIITWPNFTFGQLCMWIGANNDQIWLPMGYMSDSEQCSNLLELDLILLLVIFSCDLGQIMTRYDTSYGLNGSFWAMFEPTELDLISFLVQLFMWIGANNDQIWLPMG